MKTPKGKIALIDMHNDTAFAVKTIQECIEENTPMATVQSSLDGFLEKATDLEKAIYEKYRDKIQILPDLLILKSK